MDNPENNATFSSVGAVIGDYIKLLVEDTRLNVAEKLTRLLSAIALCSLLTIVVTVALVFVSIAVGLALTHIFSPLLAFSSVAAFYIILMIILIAARKKLLADPIARFISVLLLDPPQEPTPTNDSQPTTVS